ncbi:MAG: GHKL domain-containing protein [Eubacteriales bacterium]
MNYTELLLITAKYVIPGIFSMLFRIFGLGMRSKRAAVAGMTVFLSVSLIIPLTFIPIVGYDVYKHYCAIVIIAANASVFIISSDSFLKTCFMHFTQSNIVFWIATTLGALSGLLNLSYLELVVFTAISCALAYVIALRWCVKPMRFMAEAISTGWLGLLAVPGCTVLAGVATAVWFGTQENYSTVMMICVTGLFEFSFVMYMRGLYGSMCRITALARENTRQKLLETELSAYTEFIDSAKQARHDLRHHNALILNYLETGGVEDAVSYLRQAENALSDSALTEFSPNPTVNAVLRIYSRQAQEHDISYAALADLPDTLPLTAPELGALLSNMLENAVEACMKLEAGKRRIAVRTRTDEKGFRLEVCNSVCGDVAFEGGFPMSTKPGGGTGTKSIANIVKKYEGMLRFKQEGGEFFTQILIPHKTCQ